MGGATLSMSRSSPRARLCVPLPAGVDGSEVGVASGTVARLRQPAQGVERRLPRRLEGESTRLLAAALETGCGAEGLADVLGAKPRLAQQLVCWVCLAPLLGGWG